MFLDLKSLEGGFVTFEGMGKEGTVGKGKIGKTRLPTIDNILCVEGIKYNL